MKLKSKWDGVSLTCFRVLLLFVCVYNGYTYAQQTLTAVKLKITDVSSGFSDEIVVYFQPSASEAYDRSVDALKLFSENQEAPSLFTKTKELLPLSIQCLNLESNEVTVPVFLKSQTSTRFSMSMLLPADAVQPKGLYLTDLAENCFYNGYRDFPVMMNKNQTNGLKPSFLLTIQEINPLPPTIPPCSNQTDSLTVR